jgi:hypothetical protein
MTTVCLRKLSFHSGSLAHVCGFAQPGVECAANGSEGRRSFHFQGGSVEDKTVVHHVPILVSRTEHYTLLLVNLEGQLSICDTTFRT